MLKIRLQKIGKKNAPSYRVALVEHTTSPQGKFIEILGTYNPRTKKKNFNKEKIEYWLTKGAQASPTVFNLLVDEKIIEREKLMAWKPKKQKEEAKPATPEAPKTEEVKTEEPKPVEETPPIESSPSAEGERLDSSPLAKGEGVDPSPLNKGERVDTEPKKE